MSQRSRRSTRFPSGPIGLTACCIMALMNAGAATVSVAAQPAALPSLDGVYVASEPRGIADFVLTDQDGRQRRFSSLRGQPVLVFFGFTHCTSICPEALARLQAVHAADRGAVRAARVVMISVDGERDTPAVLKAFLAPVSPDFIGLTGDPKTTTKIAAQFAAMFFKEPARKDGNYDVMHSGEIFAVDKRGRLRASFGKASVEDMAKVTAVLLGEPG